MVDNVVVNDPVGNGLAAPALVVSPSNAFGPLKNQFPTVKVEPSGPVLLFLYAQPSKCSQSSPVPSVSMSPKTSITELLWNISTASSPLIDIADPAT